jgi:hypothetical protein|tara:strand:- start:2 stop:400 length:399 start_codon:yes stop_codon:yes gene_type:complete
MTITTENIRDLLNRPRGLNEATITEYITIRTEQVTKNSRKTTSSGLAPDSTNAVTTAQKESAIKALVCMDCLQVLIDTSPSYVRDSEKKETDIRIAAQLNSFRKRADELLAIVQEKGGMAVLSKLKSTKTKQ